MQESIIFRREGLTVLNNPTDPDFDVIFLHGLNGHPLHSFENENSGFYWPSDFAKHTSSVRVMAFGYIADFSSGSRNAMGIHQHATSLLVNLRNHRIVESDRPLAFVCHSLGGLVVKQALVLSSVKDVYKEILTSTKLICFMGTPHRGSHVLEKMKVAMLEKLAKAAFHEIPSNLKSTLKPRSHELFEINNAFAGIKGNVAIINFYEQKHMKGLDELIVDKDSAILYFENEESIPLYRDHRELIRFENAADDAYRLILQTLQIKLSTLSSQTKLNMHQSLTAKMRLECLRSLKFPESQKRASEILEPSGSTLHWLYDEHVGYTRWVNQDDGVYWIVGKPGSGKSTLMKEIASQYYERHSQQESVTVTHFFNGRGMASERSMEGFLKSILEQILRQEPRLFDCLMEDFARHLYHRCQCCSKDGEMGWTLRSLKSALKTIVVTGDPKIQICLFVDALDECDTSVKDVIVSLQQLMNDARVHLKLCISSRTFPDDMLRMLPASQGFILQEHNSKDIFNFVNDKITSNLFPDHTDEANRIFIHDLNELKKEIIEKADGVFLWVDIVLSEIERGIDDGNTITELRENLRATPSELSGLFDVLLQKVDASYIAETNIMLSVVLNAARPLSLSEFRYVMAFSSDETFTSQHQMETSKNYVQTDIATIKRIRSRCGGLLEAKALQDSDEPSHGSSRHVVQFIHQSVKDYFLSGRENSDSKLWGSKDLTAKGHSSLSRACLKYLCTRDTESVSTYLENLHDIPWEEKCSALAEDFPFLEYSATMWMKHCSQAEKLGAPQARYFDMFTCPGERYFEIWCEVHDRWLNPSKPLGIDITPMQLAVKACILSFVQVQIENGVDINGVLAGRFISYLQMAAFLGDEDMVNLLLDHGANIEARGGDSDSILAAACRSGNVKIVRKILEARPDTSSYGLKNGPLIAASISGNAEIIKALYEHDRHTYKNDWNRHLAILSKTLSNWEKILDASKDQPNFSLDHDDDEVSELLLSQGADFFTFGIAAPWIQCMLMNISPSTIKKLLTEDSEMCNRRDWSGYTLLHLVCATTNDEAIVRLLLENGADSTAITDDGMSVFHLALRNRSESVLKCLLDMGFDPGAGDIYGVTPFHQAAQDGTDYHLYLLISAHGKVVEPDVRGFLPIHYAMSNRRLTDKANLEVFVDSGLGVNVKACDDSTPLHIAARYGKLLHVQWLLGKGADVNAVDSEGRTALHCAAANNDNTADRIIELLIAHSQSVHSKDDSGFTALHNVFHWVDGPFFGPQGSEFKRQKFGIVKSKLTILLRSGADINAQDLSGNSVLHLACAQDSRLVVRLLLDKGADPKLMDFQRRRPVDFARLDHIRALLED